MKTPLASWIMSRWPDRVWVSLFLTLTAGTWVWAQDVHLPVVVEAGQLSIDLREAPVREVLATIGRQAGLRVRMEAGDARLVTAQFPAMALEPGLRRLLRAAALSYALEYTPGPGTTATLHAVRVFGATRDSNHDRPSSEALAHAEAPEAVDPDLPELDTEAPDTSAPDLTHDWQD
jgi:hypothetical protein